MKKFVRIVALLWALPLAAQNWRLSFATGQMDPIVEYAYPAPAVTEVPPGRTISFLVWDENEHTVNASLLEWPHLTLYPLNLDTSYAFPVSYSTESSAWIGVIPWNVPLGPAELVFEAGGSAATVPVPVRIVRTLFTLDSTFTDGRVPAWRLLPDGSTQDLGFSTPGRPGDLVRVSGAGLGLAALSEIRLEVAGVPAQITYAGPWREGKDQIQFQIPTDARLDGCYLTIQTFIGNRTSNRASIPVSQGKSGGCRHPLGLTFEEMAAVDRRGSVPVGELSVFTGWGTAPSERAVASFQDLQPPYLDFQSTPQLTDEQEFSCRMESVVRGVIGMLIDTVLYYDAGPALILRGGPKSLDFSLDGQFRQYSYNGSGQLNLQPGDWKLVGPGGVGVDMAAFEWPFTLPPVPMISNLAEYQTLSQPADVELRWDGSQYREGEKLTVSIEGAYTAGEGRLVCSAPAQGGRLKLELSRLGNWSHFGRNPPLNLTVERRSGRPLVYPVPLKSGRTLRGSVKYSVMGVAQ